MKSFTKLSFAAILLLTSTNGLKPHQHPSFQAQKNTVQPQILHKGYFKKINSFT